jgi:hypothetical protein
MGWKLKDLSPTLRRRVEAEMAPATALPAPSGKKTNPGAPKKASDEDLIQAYAELKNVWKVAERLGMCGQSVHERLSRLDVKLRNQPLTTPEKERIRAVYGAGLRRGDGRLGALAAELKRTKNFISRFARSEGLTDNRRGFTEEAAAANGERAAARTVENGHPKGMKGKKHSAATKEHLSQTSAKAWADMPPEKKSAAVYKSLRTREANGTLHSEQNPKKSWKAGWRTISGRKIYFRSRWEYNYACYLEWLKAQKNIQHWEHEPKTFWFENIKRGVRSYLPDFYITENNGEGYYLEVKGWMDDRSKTKLKRMKKYYPEVPLRLVDSKAYRALAKQVRNFVPGWEQD